MNSRTNPAATVLGRITTDMSAAQILAECRDVNELQKLRSDQVRSIFELILSKSTRTELEAIGQVLDKYVAGQDEGAPR